MRHKKLLTLSIILFLLAIFAFAACDGVHKVQFDWNCDDLEPVSRDYFSGDTVQFPDSVKREGYWFCGWYTDQQCTQAAELNYVVGQTDLTLYAQWMAWPKSLTATLSKDAVLGCELTADDFSVEVTYWDGTTKQANSSQIFIEGLLSATAEAGEKQLTVYYTENDRTVQCTVNLTVQPVKLVSISATYEGGDLVVGDTITEDDFVVTAFYNNGQQTEISSFAISGYNAEISGQQTVTITYGGKTAEVIVTVQPVLLESIDVVYVGGELVVGDELVADDFDVVAIYNNGDEVPVTNFEILGYDSTTSGTKTVTISFDGKTAEVVVTVQPVEPEYILAEFKKDLQVYCGDQLTKEMFVVTAIYNNGTSQTVTDFEILGYDSTASGTQTVKIKFGGKTAEATLTVFAKILVELEAELNDNVQIYCGDELKNSMFTVVATYNNGDAETITNFEILGYDSTSSGTQTVTISFGGKTVFVIISVQPVTLVSVSATYSGGVVVGEQLDFTKLTVKATYNNGAIKQIETYNCGTIDTAVAGTKTLEISYTENGITETCQVQITVNESGVIANGNLSIHFLELGNRNTGDSVYIKAGDTDILIDAGSRKDSAATIGTYVDQYCTDGVLEYVIVTHAHQDHIAGFVGESGARGIFERYECANIIEFARTDVKTQIYSNYQTARNAEVAAGANCYTALECVNNANGAQKVYDLTDNGDITMEVLYQKFYENKSSDENNYSVCVLISQGDNHYLFTGDLEADGEASLVESNPNLPEVVLFKGGHHGSYTSSTEKLLSKIKPEYVCVCCCAGTTEYTKSVGPHTFPAQEFVDRVAKYTDKVYVTSLAVLSDSGKLTGATSMNGNIVFSCNYGEISLNCSNNNTKLKDTDWFKNNRTCPDEWKSDE